MILGVNPEHRGVYLYDLDIKGYDYPWGEEYWEKEASKSIIRIWIDPTDRVPRGFVAYRFVPLKEIVNDAEGSVVHLQKLTVHPSWRSQGIGTELLLNVESTAMKQGVILLMSTLHELNDTGRGWAQRRGFTGHSVHREIYSDGCDGYTFIKELS